MDAILRRWRRTSASDRTRAPRSLISAAVLLIAAALTLAGCGGAAMPAAAPTRTPHPPLVIPTRLTASEREEIFNTVWQTVNDEYFDPTFGGMDWRAIGDKYRQKLSAVTDDNGFWLDVLNPMLWELGASHAGALPPELATQLEPMTFATGSLGVDVRPIDGIAVVTAVVGGSPADQAGIRPGFVITSVDGWTLEDISAWSKQSPPYNERHERAAPIQELRSRLYGERGKEVVVEYLDADDQPQQVSLTYVNRTGLACSELDPSTPPACAELEVRRLEGGIGYIRFSGFLEGILDGVLQALDDLRDAPGLIIDLRGNPGGVYHVRETIASHLVGTREVFIIYQYRGYREAAILDEVPDPYPGKVVILVDELSASSSEEFAGSLQALGRATIVGTQTAGSCLTANIVPLPEGGLLIYPNSQSQTPDGRVLEYNGVAPDITVTLDRQELLQGTDAQLNAAVGFLTERDGRIAGVR
jgi:carboxyl-terminal processing protease